jgi:ribosomal-protein-alanine N-acetyltransferase
VPDREEGDQHDTDVTFDDWSGLFPERIETDRLVLRRLSTETVDLRAFYEVCAHDDGIDEVIEHLTWDPHPHPKSTHEFGTAVEDAWEDGESATYLVHPKDADAFAGSCGLHVDWERRTGVLGTWLRKRFWGRGYSRERAAALVRLAFEELDLELVAVTHEAGNENSRRAIRKYVEYFGGREEAYMRNAVVTDGDPADQRRYSISRAEYRDAVEWPGLLERIRHARHEHPESPRHARGHERHRNHRETPRHARGR